MGMPVTYSLLAHGGAVTSSIHWLIEAGRGSTVRAD